MRTKRPDAAGGKRPDAAPGLTFDEYVWLGALLGKLLRRDPGAFAVTIYGHVKKEDQTPEVTLMTTRYVDGLMRMEDARYKIGGESGELVPVAVGGEAP